MATAIYRSETPTNGTNPWLDSLVTDVQWAYNGTPTVIKYNISTGAFTAFGQTVTGETWFNYEVQALKSAMAAWQAVCNVSFQEVATTATSNINYYEVSDAEMVQITGATGVLGFHDFPDPLYNQGQAVFNYSAPGWDAAGLLPGGFGYLTLVHELGHGLGLGHPFGGAQTFPGVVNSTDLGTYNLNQTLYTVMSYNDGWNGVTAYGYVLTPMAFDIAAAQILYGKNNTYHTGNDTYYLPLANQSGTGWSCIWDAGGTDTISAAGATMSCVIDIRGAQLTGPLAGGFFSYANGLHGGFSVANGVLLENIIGGNGNDTLFGNIADNFINGAGGADTMQGFSGNDTYNVDDVGDVVIEAAGNGIDFVNCYLSTYTLPGNVENVNLFGTTANTITGNELNNSFLATAGNNTFNGGLGMDMVRYVNSSAGVTIDLRLTVPQATGGSGNDTLINIENVTGSGFSDWLRGNGVGNFLIGGAGDDILNGFGGADTMSGGAGKDTYYFNTPLGAGNIDTISDFSAPDDVIYLEDTGIFTALAAGTLSPGAFTTASAALQADDRIIYDTANGALYYDPDGSGAAVAVRFATVQVVSGSLSSADFWVI